MTLQNIDNNTIGAYTGGYENCSPKQAFFRKPVNFL